MNNDTEQVYDFNEEIDRRNTYSIKYDFAAERGKPEGALPFWVADMDFKSPHEVIEALSRRCEHGIYGYSDPKGDYFNSVKNWFLHGYQLSLNQEDITVTAGVVFAINCAIRAYTKEGEGVLVQKPVYYPFFKSVIRNKRKLVNNSLINRNGHYEIDFEDFEKKIVEQQVKLFILCSPHNPVGRVWTKQELKQMGEICKKHGVIVVSDEIHSDFAFSIPHTPFWLAGSGFDAFSMICTSPSKTFNQAGLQHANILIKDGGIRKDFLREMTISGYSNVSAFGLIACMAAYNHGGLWLEQLKEYLKANIAYTKSYIEQNIPKVRMTDLEGTYLVWLDFRELGLTQSALDELITHGANLWLDSGTMFGSDGEGYQRINIATPRANVVQALENIKKAVFGL